MRSKEPKPTSTPKVTRILIVDDHPMVRERVAEVINREGDLEVCGEAEDRHEALASIERLRPDLAIVDLTLKNSHGLELIRDIQLRFEGLRILVLSMYDVPLYAQRSIRAGALGYITKKEATRNIIAAIRRVLSGQIYLSPNLATEITEQIFQPKPNAAANPVDRLTDRELQVFELIGRRQASQQIADQLHLDIKTVDSYRSRLREKLSLKDADALVTFAVKWVRSSETA